MSMALSKTSDLTELQAAFVLAYVSNGGVGTKAAIAAGYAPDNAKVTASKLLTLPHIQAALKAQWRASYADIFSAGLRRLKDVLLDPATKPAVITDIVIKVGDRLGLAPKSPGEGDGDEKEINEMTMAELDAKIQRWRAKLDAMPVINPAPAVPTTAPVIDQVPDNDK